MECGIACLAMVSYYQFRCIHPWFKGVFTTCRLTLPLSLINHIKAIILCRFSISSMIYCSFVDSIK